VYKQIRYFQFIAEEVIPLAHSISDVCINCGACDPTCPVDAISEQGDMRGIDPAVCIDCGACVDSCPVGAITPV
jgi:ferredoxin